jgi:hypothetical protein
MKTGINFVVFNWTKWSCVLREPTPTLQQVASRIITNEDIWCVQTYLQLSARGLCPTVSSVPLSGKINIVDGIGFRPRYFAPDVFCVGCRGDGHFPAFCQIVIHQNSLVLEGQPSVYVPQWPQPAIVRRDLSRGGVSTIGFFGHAGINLAQRFRDPDFITELHRRGCALSIRGKSSDEVAWNDYSKIDLVLSVRNIPFEHMLLKPVCKLTNAWIAGVPALVGPEPAIQEITESPLDYLLVSEPDDVFRALQTFNDDPKLYEKMVEHGWQRATSFSESAIASRWLEVLEVLQDGYRQWIGLDDETRALDFRRRVSNYHVHMRRHVDQVHFGYAKLGFGPRWWETPDR